jgi:hypothetical protein
MNIFLVVSGSVAFLIGTLFMLAAGPAALLDHVNNTPLRVIAVIAYVLAIAAFGTQAYLKRKRT